MADNSRIKVAKDKAELVKALIVSSDTTGPFQTYADVLVFAAALGAKHNKRISLTQVAKSIDPIRQDIFAAKRYDYIINLLAVINTKDTQILQYDENSEEERIKIFEEYANGGLEILREELIGAADYSERMLLLLSLEREKQELQEDEFDLSKFLS
ncbi:DNA phosphorothioation-associated protein 4 [Microcoleus sp. FACHB-831]|uniref:DNA phosphorothioation-associated protein 4 n=1 Tax=Microcoleus sp. FACHB-831 TaxID=2692827 RepID=UPI001687F952|nr:DNA phosphorothioation-associated protein 4 [Microcoleus sp. FACHB-831]MBD1919661.1 DNA phosphorothioation-associated protein 4 [Microcoleus sp. FACHB-831]